MVRRVHALSLLLFLAVAAPLAADWQALYAKRLDESLAYRQALTQLRQAELKVAQKTLPYMPFLGVRTGGQYGIGLLDGALQASVLTAELRFEDLLGADLTFSAPFGFGGTTATGFDNPSLTISRRIFEESEAELLKARAAWTRATAAVDKAASDVRFILVSDILDAYHSTRVVDSHRRNLAVLERLREAIRGVADERTVERRILQARKAILQADGALQAIAPDVRDNVESLYPEAQERITSWVQAMPEKGSLPPASAELEAQRLDLAAAEQEQMLSFLPFIPNPTFSASLTYDLGGRGLAWRLSFSFSTDVIDHGERATSSYLRSQGPALGRMAIDSAERSLERSVASAWNSLAILDVDRQIQALDIEDARETVDRWQTLFARGFVAEEDLIMAEIDLAAAELDAVKIEHDYARQQLRLLQYYRSASAEGTR